MRRVTLLLVFMLLAVSACGGSSGSERNDTTDQNSPGETGDEQVTVTTDAEGNANDDTPGPTSSVSVPGQATLTLNGTTHQFGGDVPGMSFCEPSMAGANYFANLPMLDESGEVIGELSGLQVFLPLDTQDFGEPPHAMFIDGEEAWLADPQEIDLGGLDPNTSQIDDYTIDGNMASGTATFFERQSWTDWSTGNADSYLVAQGTFEVTCAG